MRTLIESTFVTLGGGRGYKLDNDRTLKRGNSRYFARELPRKRGSAASLHGRLNWVCLSKPMNDYARAWKALKHLIRILRFRRQLRHVHLFPTRCFTCVTQARRRHRPCFAPDCGCPCSPPGLATASRDGSG